MNNSKPKKTMATIAIEDDENVTSQGINFVIFYKFVYCQSTHLNFTW